MIIRIEENGFLRIERAGNLKSQFCPFTIGEEARVNDCGDWCPLFGEPNIADESLEICQGRVLKGWILDVRGKR